MQFDRLPPARLKAHDIVFILPFPNNTSMSTCSYNEKLRFSSARRRTLMLGVRCGDVSCIASLIHANESRLRSSQESRANETGAKNMYRTHRGWTLARPHPSGNAEKPKRINREGPVASTQILPYCSHNVRVIYSCAALPPLI